MRVIQKKVCLLGDFAVGKTSLVRRYVEGRFDDKYLSTIGVKISRKTMQRQDSQLNLLVWDLAGGEDFDKVSTRYLMGAVGALIVCDLTRPESVDAMAVYAGQMAANNQDSHVVFAANKADLVEERRVTDEALNSVFGDLHFPLFLTSAKTGLNVEAAFEKLAELILPIETG